MTLPALAKAIDCDPAHLLRLALDQTVGSTSAAAIVDILGSPVTVTLGECVPPLGKCMVMLRWRPANL